jgi:ATP-dependent Lon protease
MNIELQKLELKNDIQSKVRFDLDQQQREYFLHQQMKTIQEELGGVSKRKKWTKCYKVFDQKWDDKTKSILIKNCQNASHESTGSDFGIQRNYLELFLDLPWNEYSKDIFDLKRAQKILDRDHFGLEEVKE